MSVKSEIDRSFRCFVAVGSVVMVAIVVAVVSLDTKKDLQAELQECKGGAQGSL